MGAVDWAVFAGYLAGIVLLAAVFVRRVGDTGEYFLARRSMGWFPIGLSIMVTAFSAVNYTAFSGEVSAHGLYAMLSLPVFVIVAWPINRLIMPFYHSMRLCTAYEYLQRRFDARVRRLASGLFMLWRVAWMAVALYVPCRVLNMVTGLPLYGVILVAGGVATLYTVAGGMRSVMWTDVAQFFVLLGGLVVGIAMASGAAPGGLGGMLREGVAAGLARPFYPFDPAVLSPSPAVRISIWSALIGTSVAFLARYGADQVMVQRYLTARSLRDARLGFHLNYAAALLTLTLLALLGFAIRAHAAQAGLLGASGVKPIGYFAAFVLAMPRGVTGLIVAGLFAATMSSVDSGVNSCSAAFVNDFQMKRPALDGPQEPQGEKRRLLEGRLMTVAFGLAAVGAAFYVGRLGTIFEIANKIINSLGSPLLALLLLGMFSRRSNAPGMLIGGAVGAAWSVAAPLLIKNLSLHYYAVVNLLVTLGACYACSLLATSLGHRPPDESAKWTWWRWRLTPRREG